MKRIFTKTAKQILCLLCGGTMISGCNAPTQNTIPEILLSHKDPLVQMKFSEIADSPEIIRLETSDSILIPNRLKLCIGEKYMVAMYSDGIHQFGKDGKYIRHMFSQGRGAGEYFLFCSQGMDETGRRYFMTDLLGQFFSYDLEDGKIMENRRQPFGVYIHKVVQDTLFCFPDFSMKRRTYPYLSFTLTPQGEFIHGLVDTIVDGTMFSVSYSSSPDGEIHLKKQTSDTMYRIDGYRKRPVCILKEKHLQQQFPLIITLLQESRNYYFFQVACLLTEYGDNGQLMSVSSMGKTRVYRVNKQNYRSETVENVYFDLLDTAIPIDEIHIGEKTTHFALSAFQVREALKEKIEQGSLSPELEKLYLEVGEEDNPVIFVGRNK